jgi:hypothetical protein
MIALLCNINVRKVVLVQNNYTYSLECKQLFLQVLHSTINLCYFQLLLLAAAAGYIF